MKVPEALLDAARDDAAEAIDMVKLFSHSSSRPSPRSPGPGMWLHGATAR